MSSIYEANQKCLLLIPKIVLNLRKQFFFKASKQFLEVIASLSDMLKKLPQEKDIDADINEIMELLQGLVRAQENQDYILIADILENDLLPMLQKIQMSILTAEEVPDYWQSNMEALKQADAAMYNLMSDKSERSGKYEMVRAINGQPVIKVFMQQKEYFIHSMVNPQWEAEIYGQTYTEEKEHTYAVWGMGMGYHVKAILNMDDRNHVTVLENDLEVLQLAFQYSDWGELLREGRVCIRYQSDLSVLSEELKKCGNHRLLIYYPSLQAVEDEKLRTVLEDYFVVTATMREQRKSLEENFSKIQQAGLLECSALKEIFCRQDVVIAAGGPSVDYEIEAIKKYRSKFKILAVGTIAGKLLENGIEPDAIIITDPQKHMYHQIEGLATENIPLFLLSTASSAVLKYYRGPAYVVYQEGYKEAEEIAGKKKYELFQTGGSVSTLALDIAIRFCAEKIILVGFDMAYTEKKSHASGIGREISDDLALRKVESTDSKILYTSKNLDIYRKWIEKRIAEENGLRIFNTSRGARIAGTKEKRLEEIYCG